MPWLLLGAFPLLRVFLFYRQYATPALTELGRGGATTSTAPLGLPYGFDYWSERNAVLDVEPEEVVELLWRALREARRARAHGAVELDGSGVWRRGWGRKWGWVCLDLKQSESASVVHGERAK